MCEEEQLIVVSSKCLEDAAAQFVPKQGRYHHVFSLNIHCGHILVRSHEYWQVASMGWNSVPL